RNPRSTTLRVWNGYARNTIWPSWGSSAVNQPAEAPGQGTANCRNPSGQPDNGVADRTRGPRQCGQPGQPIGHRHHVLGDGAPRRAVLVERAVRTAGENR